MAPERGITGSPACILVPATEAHFHDHLLQGSESRHFITTKEFKQWLQTHPDVQLRPATAASATLKPPPSAPPTAVTVTSADAETSVPSSLPSAAPQSTLPYKPEPYKAPQHPTSHMLQSIPPRAPSQSSRSNILSYTLHLATSARLASYTHPNGSQTLLNRAESSNDTTATMSASIDVEWLESELKAQGMWRLGASLLKANKREGHLAPSVERRVALASLTEDLLVHPAAADAFSPVSDAADVVASDEIESLATLKPLTSHDTTKLYLTTTSRTDDKAATSSSSVAQSLIDLKFGKSSSSSSSPNVPDPSVDKAWQDAGALFGGGEVDQSNGGNVSGSNNGAVGAAGAAAPHMDYRIVRQQTMRTRAKSIYGESILPRFARETRSFCRRHRVAGCNVCTTVSNTKLETRHKAIPGQGLETFGGELVGGKRPLVEVVPKFLDLSAHLLRDIRERIGSDGDDGGIKSSLEMQATAAWYDLLHSLLTQACLEGYLVDGWTGTSGIETLFGVGCGVWEGRGWAKRIEEQRRAEEQALQAAKDSSGSHVEVVEGEELDDDDSDSDASDESDESEEQEQRLERERERTRLVDAAQQLFGSRDVAQAEFERSMRDRIHEFLNVADGQTLESHLLALNARYPLSAFEADMVDFLECTTRFLGKPALAKASRYGAYESTSSSASATSASATADEADFYALTKFFAQVEPSGAGTPVETIDDPSRFGKRRRVL
ncbi:hypothetical protein OIV83_006342 [Microbotryomycetes sp. JL201]|nr:hypothetical protein OIV83_006342 [Microbotryomycetes sp. JL201]